MRKNICHNNTCDNKRYSTYITCGIDFGFNGSWCIIDLSQGDTLINLTCLFAFLVPLSIG